MILGEILEGLGRSGHVTIAEHEGRGASQNLGDFGKVEVLERDGGEVVLVDVHLSGTLADVATKLLGFLDGKATSVDEPATLAVLEELGKLLDLLDFLLCRHAHLPSCKSTPAA